MGGDALKLTDEQKQANRIARFEHAFKCVSYLKAKNAVATIFQRLRRLESANDNGMCQCITCGKPGHWKQMEGGHWIRRRHECTLYDPRNVNPQCNYCNQHLNGNEAEHRKKLVAIYGKAQVEAMEESMNEKRNFTRLELATMKAEFLDREKVERKRVGE